MEDLFVYRTIRGRIDLGPIEDAEGRTTNERPRLVKAEDNCEYICKFLDEAGPEVMGAELIAGAIALGLNLPVPRFAVLHLGRRKAFASLRVADKPVSLRAGLLERTENVAVVPDLIAFDTFIENRDRKQPGNTIFVRSGINPEKPYRLYTIDHSSSGLRFYRAGGEHGIGADTLNCDGHPLLWEQIRGYDDFHSACERIATLGAGELSRIVGRVQEHIGTSQFDGLDQVLLWRAQGIRGLVVRAVERFLGQRETRKGDEHE